MGALADDILNIPYIDSDNMDEYLKNLADRADELEIKRDKIKQLLNMHYGVPKVNFDPEEHKEWLYDKFNVKPMNVHMELMQIINRVHEETDNFIFETIKPWCEERIQRKISKVDLEQALLMYYSLDKEDPEPTSQILNMRYGVSNMTIDDAILILDCERPYSSRGCGSDVREKEAALIMGINALKRMKNNETI